LQPGLRVNVVIEARVWSLEFLQTRLRDACTNRAILADLAGALAHPVLVPEGCALEAAVWQGVERSLLGCGQVLTVPESSVVDTGKRQIVYVEGGPGMFDAVEVDLGPRIGESYPVLRGLEEGRRVATVGTFLIDAETKLNPGLAAGYFGATRSGLTEGPSEPARPPANANSWVSGLAGLSPADRALAEKQGVCLVTGKPLGSMGTPGRLQISGRVVFVCCSGCEEHLLQNPDKFLSKLPSP
jgi:hypothetical protein